MTNRARWILAVAICGMLLGMFFRVTHFAILNLIFVSWIFLEWFLFHFRTIRGNAVVESIDRRIDGSVADAVSLTISQPVKAELGIVFHRSLHGLRAFVTDLVPLGIEGNGRWPAVIDIRGQGRIQWNFQLTPQITGQLALPGLQVTLTDKYGFFRKQAFVKHRQTLTLLPLILQPRNTAEKVKRDNIQLLNGLHRFRKPGISSELLGIREYQKGDPPRSIAWKATARTGRLMTCEYESEVPIRSTILADVSGYQFWGRPDFAPFDLISSTVASLTKLLTEDKDPVGLVLASAENQVRVRHGLGQRQMIRVLESLMRSSPSSSTASEYSIRELESFVWKSIYRIQPELLEDSVNSPRVPWMLYGPRRRYQHSLRRQAAVALNWILGGRNMDGVAMIHDDERFRTAADLFFSRFPALTNEATLVADFGVGRVEKESAVRTLCRGLVESVARAHDNELFVLVGNFNVRPVIYRELVNAIRVARARYHRLVMINIPPGDVIETVANPTAKQAFEYVNAINSNDEVRHHAAIEQLGVRIATLHQMDLLEQVVGELQILKSAGHPGLLASGRGAV